MGHRELSKAEMRILDLIRVHYGSLNTPEEVTFTDTGEAVIWVKKDDRSVPLMANLTNLAAWRADGTIATDDELLHDWLRVNTTSE